MTQKDRILTYIRGKGIKMVDFFGIVGISPSNFKGEAKKSELGGDKLAKILTIYKDLSAEWLILGKGSMLNDKNTIFESDIVSDPIVLPYSYKNNKNEKNNIDLSLFETIKNQTNIIREQAEEIGRLRERLDTLKNKI